MALRFFLASSVSKLDRNRGRLCPAFGSFVSKRVNATVPRSHSDHWRTQIKHISNGPRNVASLDSVSSALSPVFTTATSLHYESLLLQTRHAARLFSGDAVLNSNVDEIGAEARNPSSEAAGAEAHDQDALRTLTPENEDMQRLVNEYRDSSEALKTLPDYLRQIPQADPRGKEKGTEANAFFFLLLFTFFQICSTAALNGDSF